MPPRTCLTFFAIILLAATASTAAEKNQNAAVDKALEPAKKWPGVIRSNIGVTRLGTKIPCLISNDDLDYGTKKKRILFIGGLDGSKKSVEALLTLMESFYVSKDARKCREKYAVSAIPIANPDAWATGKGPGNLSGGFPVKHWWRDAKAYGDKINPEIVYLKRWLGMHAPDRVHFVGTFSVDIGLISRKSNGVAGFLVGVVAMDGGVVKTDNAAKWFEHYEHFQGLIELIRLNTTSGPFDAEPRKPRPPARAELQRRIARTPIQIAEQLSKRYGHKLNNVAYIPSLALIGRLRLGEMTGDSSHRKDVENIVAPYFTGKKPTFGKRISGSMMPGHLVFGELARTETDPKKRAQYISLARRAADLGFDENGKPKPSMPAHSEMSDAVFMGGPILTQVGTLTGDAKYHDMAVRHLRFMLKLNLRKDGLHRHSPLNETAWGRGNGFPALGLALCLSDLPKDHARRAELLAAFQSHMTAMARHQDPTGMWHQVVDRDESYRELTVTCMTTFAMIRGVRNGWLDKKKYTPIVARAWTALKTRIAPDATLVDVCTGTGKQRSLRAYYDRTAILGHDDRGGAMALMVTTEMMAWERKRAK